MSKIKITVTEALAEVRTIEKRLAKKRQFVVAYLFRQEALKDPLAKEGGTPDVISRELQSINDLEDRRIALRKAITESNLVTKVTVGGLTRPVGDWLVWRREVAPQTSQFLSTLSRHINDIRMEAQRKGVVTVAAGAEARPDDVIINLDEMMLAEEIERLEEILGTLDGALSLSNATTFVEI